MKKYAYIIDGFVNQIIYVNDVPLNEMFSSEITKRCVEIDENKEVTEGMKYDEKNNLFYENVD